MAKKKTKKKLEKQKIIGAVLIATGVLLLLVVGVLVWNKLGYTSISKFLPQKETIGFLEVNIGNQGQLQKAQKLFEKDEIYTKENIFNTVYNLTGLKLEYATFIQGKVAIAFLKSKENQATPVIFVGMKSKNEALGFIEALALTEKGDEFICAHIDEEKICSFKLSYNVNLAFIQDYLVISPSRETLLSVLKTKDRLSNERKYIQVRDNLPTRNLAFAYIDYENLLVSLFENEDFVAQKGYELTSLIPLLKIFRSQGLVLVAQDQYLAAQAYTYLDKDSLNEDAFITFDKKYRADLAQYVGEKPLAFFGGSNIKTQIDRVSKILSGNEKTKELLFEGVIKAQVEKYLGDKISLEEDIYPLMEGEYAFSLEGDKEQQKYKILLEISDDEGKEAIKKIIQSFVETNAVFAPKVVEVELEDGTIAKEIIATEEEIEELKSLHDGVEVVSLKFGTQDWGINYAFLDKIAIFATTKESVIESINLIKNPEKSFKESYVFKNLVNSVLVNSDEVSMFNFDLLMKELDLENEILKQYLSKIGAIISGKNFFDDGIATTNYILIK